MKRDNNQGIDPQLDPVRSQTTLHRSRRPTRKDTRTKRYTKNKATTAETTTATTTTTTTTTATKPTRNNARRLRSAPMQGGRASLWRLVPPTDMKAEEVDEATPKMLTRISKWQKDEAKYTLLVEWTNQQK